MASPLRSANPQSAREHRVQCADGLRHDGSVVPLAGSIDDAEREIVVTSAAPSHDQAKAECPWRRLHGEKWPEHIATSVPACSTPSDIVQHSPREICSWLA